SSFLSLLFIGKITTSLNNQTNKLNEKYKLYENKLSLVDSQINLAKLQNIYFLKKERSIPEKIRDQQMLKIENTQNNICSQELKQAYLYNVASEEYLNLGLFKQSELEIQNSEFIFKRLEINDQNTFNSPQGLKVFSLTYKIKGMLLEKQQKKSEAIQSYSSAIDIHKTDPDNTSVSIDSDLLTAKDIRYIHERLAILKAASGQNAIPKEDGRISKKSIEQPPRDFCLNVSN
ncbi:hypothetical protein ACWATR_38800, partial [Nostoc sp. UIC 10890]